MNNDKKSNPIEILNYIYNTLDTRINKLKNNNGDITEHREFIETFFDEISIMHNDILRYEINFQFTKDKKYNAMKLKDIKRIEYYLNDKGSMYKNFSFLTWYYNDFKVSDSSYDILKMHHTSELLSYLKNSTHYLRELINLRAKLFHGNINFSDLNSQINSAKIEYDKQINYNKDYLRDLRRKISNDDLYTLSNFVIRKEE